MSITKQKLVEQVCQLLVDGAGVRLYGPKSTVVTERDRKWAEAQTVEFLEAALLQLKNEQVRIAAVNSIEVQRINEARRRDQEQFQRDMAWNNIFRTVLSGGKVAVDNAANRGVIESWLHPHESLSQAVFAKAIGDTPRLIDQLVVQSADVLDPVKQRQAAAVQAEDDRALFSQMARQNNVADTGANFLLVRSLIASGFDRSRLAHALTMRGLSAATAEDQQQWKEERIEQENTRLASDEASPREKRQIAYQRTVDEHRTNVHTQIEFELVTGFERDVVYGGKASPLPQEWSGQPLTSEFIRKCDKNTLKTMIHRYGSSQVTARLRGIKRASAVLDRGNGKGPVEVSYEFA
jgi:hypothetical protein